MKTNGHDLAFPSPETENYKVAFGLSKREYFAVKIMAGFAADHTTVDSKLENLAKAAVKWADALIDELNYNGKKTKGEKNE